jgi:hypothetical protein
VEAWVRRRQYRVAHRPGVSVLDVLPAFGWAEGKKPRRAEPKPKPSETGPKHKDQINLTEEESRIMPAGNEFLQGFNAQAVVHTETMLVMAAHATQDVNDKRHCPRSLSSSHQS